MPRVDQENIPGPQRGLLQGHPEINEKDREEINTSCPRPIEDAKDAIERREQS